MIIALVEATAKRLRYKVTAQNNAPTETGVITNNAGGAAGSNLALDTFAESSLRTVTSFAAPNTYAARKLLQGEGGSRGPHAQVSVTDAAFNTLDGAPSQWVVDVDTGSVLDGGSTGFACIAVRVSAPSGVQGGVAYVDVVYFDGGDEMSNVELKAYDASGAPLGGLTPSWVSYHNADTGASIIGSAPTIHDRGDGTYWFTESVGIQASGFVLWGGAALPQYDFYAAEGVLYVFPAFAPAMGAPVAGLSPEWSVCRDADTSADLLGSAPVISEVGDGAYKFTIPTDKNLSGFIHFASGASPAYEAVETDVATVGGTDPIISGALPEEGTVPSQLTPVTFNVSCATADIDFVEVTIKYAGSPETIVIFDGDDFQSPFNAGDSTKTVNTARNIDFSILPLGGWRGDIEDFRVYARAGGSIVEGP